MTELQFRNAHFIGPEAIEMEINHPVFGWIPFTATPDDVEEHGRLLFEAAKDVATAYTPPPPEPEPVPAEISRRQFFQILEKRGLITKAEALSALTTGTLPAAFEAVIADIPTEDGQFDARMLLVGASMFRRDSALVPVFAAHVGYTSEQTDQLWRDGAAL